MQTFIFHIRLRRRRNCKAAHICNQSGRLGVKFSYFRKSVALRIAMAAISHNKQHYQSAATGLQK